MEVTRWISQMVEAVFISGPGNEYMQCNDHIICRLGNSIPVCVSYNLEFIVIIRMWADIAVCYICIFVVTGCPAETDIFVYG